MQEKFLHFIWQYQYFAGNTLQTDPGGPVQVIYPGEYNEHGGPDFLFACLIIDGIEWRGHVEIHVKSSDWYEHNHQLNPAYDAVILHIVWNNDQEVYRSEGTMIRTISLRDRISLSVFSRYRDLAGSIWHIPCGSRLPTVSSGYLDEEVRKAFLRRLKRKVNDITSLLRKCVGDWEYLSFLLLMEYAGGGRNKTALLRLAGLLPFRALRRHSQNPFQVEAMIFGVAGFLENSVNDAYHDRLITEFSFFKKKYKLPVMGRQEWRFLRMRPSNFPTARLAAMSSLFCHYSSLFTQMIERRDKKSIADFFDVPLPEYWTKHYMFGKKTVKTTGGFGTAIRQIMAVNVILPLQAAYATYYQRKDCIEFIAALYKELPPENNRYIRLWETCGIIADSAFTTQGLLELYKSGCSERRCLECVVGRELLRES